MNALRIGRIFGIDIRIDASWLVIVGLLTWSLSRAFSQWHPDWPDLEPTAVALAAALIFFGCVLLHELAHSVVARHYGLRVRSITLFLLGGISNIERDLPSARAEFFTAAVGPLISLLLGIGFSVAVHLLTPMSTGGGEAAGGAWLAQLGPIQTLLAWLGPVNVVIALFNLLPAFPLDGGRVLRSILWAVGKDLRVATRRASIVGQAFGWLLILAGASMVLGGRIALFGTGVVHGVWLAFIGWFLRGAAAQAYRRVAAHDLLEGHAVEELMRRDGPTVTPDTPLSELVPLLAQSDGGTLPVVRDGQLLGLVFVTDVHRVARNLQPSLPTGSVMRERDAVSVAEPREPLAAAFDELARQGAAQLPVLDHGRFVGMIQRGDIGRWLDMTKTSEQRRF